MAVSRRRAAVGPPRLRRPADCCDRGWKPTETAAPCPFSGTFMHLGDDSDILCRPCPSDDGMSLRMEGEKTEGVRSGRPLIVWPGGASPGRRLDRPRAWRP